MRKLTAEVLGTFALVFAGTGAVVINDVSGGTVTHVGIALTFGLVVLAMVYAVGDVSGARRHGAGKVEAYSAGSRPSGGINPKAIEAMEEVGYDLTTHTSKGLDGFNGQKFDAAVTMGCGDECPLVLAKRRLEWQIPDPRDMPPGRFRVLSADRLADKIVAKAPGNAPGIRKNGEKQANRENGAKP
jgi:arsenate reductase (thioredoxin)